MADSRLITRRTILKTAPLALTVAVPVSMKSAVSDPMLEAIQAYRAGKAAFMAIPASEVTFENEDGLVDSTYGPAMDTILNDRPKVASITGVREAIRFAFEEDTLTDRAAENALRSALAYLDAV